MVRIVVRMDLERMFMNQFSIKKKPDNIFDLIEAAVGVAEVNYPTQLEKHKDKLLKQLMNSGKDEIKNCTDDLRKEETTEDVKGLKEETTEDVKGLKKEETTEDVKGLKKEETTEDVKGLKKEDFETSKRKFKERFAEQKEAKRRIVMVDFHDMPKPAKDPAAAPKRCWNRTRF